MTLDDFETRVREGQIHPSTPVCFPVVTQDRWVDARELELFQRLFAPEIIHFTQTFSLGRFPLFTTALCIMQVILFFWVAGWERVASLDDLVFAGAKWQPLVLELGETWRLVTANVLHRDILHLFFNLFFLFNIGGALENAYRLGDYALVLWVSALTTTTLSAWMSTAPSVGASGMVLGAFGAASVFGYKYSEILPKKYRRYFGGAALPYALFILYVGLASKDTDNWGHLGGLIGGIAVALFLRPRLLHIEHPRSRWQRYGPGWVMMAFGGMVLAAQVVISNGGPSFVTVTDDVHGIRFAYPARWATGQNHLQMVAVGNPIGTSIAVNAEQRVDGPVQLQERRRHFLQTQLQLKEREGEITAVRIVRERPILIEGGRALELDIDLDSRVGPQRTRNILIARGMYVYTLVLTVPKARADAYAVIFERMLAAVELVEPRALVMARRKVSVFPGMSSAHIALAKQLDAIGEVEAAAQAYQRALVSVPESAEALYGLARLAADHNEDLDTAVQTAAELVDRYPDSVSYVSLLAELRRRLGQMAGACAVLQQTLDRLPEPPEALRKQLIALRCRSGG